MVKLVSRMHSKFWLASAVAVLSRRGGLRSLECAFVRIFRFFACPAAPRAGAAAPRLAEVAPPADQTGGFDGAQAYEHVAKLVSFGPRPPASEGLHRSQEYIIAQLKVCRL